MLVNGLYRYLAARRLKKHQSCWITQEDKGEPILAGTASSGEMIYRRAAGSVGGTVGGGSSGESGTMSSNCLLIVFRSAMVA